MSLHRKCYERGQLLLQQNRYNEAADEFRQLLAADPNDDIALNFLAQCQLRIPGRAKEALATVSQAIGINADQPFHFVIKAQCLCELDRDKEAVEAAGAAIAIDPDDAVAYGMRAAAYTGLMRWADAEDDCRRALALNPDDGHAANLLALALRSQNKLVENDQQISGLLAENPEDAFTHANAGWTALRKDDLAKAQEHFMESLRLDPTCEYARRGLLDSFKARSWFYRMYLKYSFMMQQFTASRQLILIFGFLFVQQLALSIFTGKLAFIGTLITIVYLALVLWSWVASGVGDLLVYCDRVARYSLKREEVLRAIFVGGGVAAGFMMMLAGILVNAKALFVPGYILLGAAFPFSMSFTNRHVPGRYLYGAAGAALLVGAAICFLHYVTPAGAMISEAAVASMQTTLYYVFMASMWLGVFHVMRR